LLNAEVAKALPVVLVILVVLGGIVAAIIKLWLRITTWVEKFKDGILASFKEALGEHERAENERFNTFDRKLDKLEVDLGEAREKLARIEGRLGE
jgi:hypothetical protein